MIRIIFGHPLYFTISLSKKCLQNGKEGIEIRLPVNPDQTSLIAQSDCTNDSF